MSKSTAKKSATPKAAKTKAVKAAAVKESSGVRLHPDHSRYSRVVGEVKATYDNGDAVAVKLRNLTLDGLYDFVTAQMVKAQRPPINLRAKYQHLNNGMQRMNLGNLLRGLTPKAPAVEAKAPVAAKPAKAAKAPKAKAPAKSKRKAVEAPLEVHAAPEEMLG